MKAINFIASASPVLIDGGIHQDDRGQLRFVNNVELIGIKRFYIIANNSVRYIRAWQGHKVEAKLLFCIKGTFVIGVVKVDDFTNPSQNLEVSRFTLTEALPQALVIPAGYANGIRALTNENCLLVFSTLSFEDGINDNYRYPPDSWVL